MDDIENQDVQIEDDGYVKDIVYDSKNDMSDQNEGELEVQIQGGDYLIHVFIEHAKRLNIKDHVEIIPYVNIPKLKVAGFGASKPDQLSAVQTTWNEHIFLETKNATRKELQDSIIQIEIQEKSEVQKVKQVGQYEFSLERIYQHKDHAILHQWVALTDISEDSQSTSEITGYLQVSMQITGKDDPSIEIKNDEPEEALKELATTQIVNIPAQIQARYAQVTMRFFMAEDLPVMELGHMRDYLLENTMDGYIQMSFAGKQFRTKVVALKKGDNRVVWNQEISFAVELPLFQQDIKVRLWDSNDGVDDTCMGTLPFNMADILKNDYQKAGWHNVYGSPVNNPDKEEEVQEMNSNPDLASTWKGRILLQIDWKETSEAKFTVENIKEEVVKKAATSWRNRKIQVVFQVGQAIALPWAEAFKVGLYINNKQLVTNFARNRIEDAQGGYNVWSQTICETIELPVESIKQIGSIFLYLIDEDEKKVLSLKSQLADNKLCISYKKLNPTKFTHDEPEWEFSQMTVDPAIAKIKNRQDGGIIQWKCHLKLVELEDPAPTFIMQDLKEMEQMMSIKKLKRPTNFKLRAYIYQCRGLTAADTDGLSDPYVQIWDKSQEHKKTKVVKNTVNPVFYQALDFDYEAFIPPNFIDQPQQVIKNFPPIILDIFDHDGGLVNGITGDQAYLSRGSINLKDASCRYLEGGTNKVLYESPLARPKNPSADTQSGNVSIIKRTATIADELTNQDTDLEKASSKKHLQPPEPQWHPLKDHHEGPDEGQILICFDISELDHHFEPMLAWEMNLRKYIKSSDKLFEINILGLRQLQSMGILPVKKASVHFDFKSLLPNGGGKSYIQNKQTDPGPSGPNPTLNTLLTCSLPLPNDKKLCPILQCTVKDNIFAGRFQPSIGQFSIDLGEILFSKEQRLNRDLQRLQLISDELQRLREHQIPDYSAQISLEEEDDLEDLATGSALSRKQTNRMSRKEKEDHKEAMVGLLKASADKADLQRTFNMNEAPNKKENTFYEQVPEYDREHLNDVDFSIIKDHNVELCKSLHLEPPANPFQDHDEPEEHVDKYVKHDRISKNENLAIVLEKMGKVALRVKKAESEKEAKLLNSRRHLIEEEFVREQFERSQRVVLAPEYTRDDRLNMAVETNVPPKELYMPLGFDPNPDSKSKHYRKYYDQELEKTKDVMHRKPFENYLIKSGKAKKQTKKFFSFGKQKSADPQKVMGYLKGIVNVFNEDTRKQHVEQTGELQNEIFEHLKALQDEHVKNSTNDGQNHNPLSILMIQNDSGRRDFRALMHDMKLGHLRILRSLLDIQQDEMIKNMLMIRTRCFVNVFLLNGHHLAARDIGSESDPYVVVELGEQRESLREAYLENEPNPDFYKMVKLHGEFPGCSVLTLRVMDRDPIFGDDEIGSTKIDLEDRFYSGQWKALRNKPIETRKLRHPSSSRNQGYIKCWVDIVPTYQELEYKYWDITPAPAEELEVRVVVFKGSDVKSMDLSGCSDVFFKGFFDPKQVHQTDTHYRCFGGDPEFNYRLKYPYIAKEGNTRTFTLQCLDRDLLTSNEIIGDVRLDLEEAVRDTCITNRGTSITKRYYEDHLKKFASWQDLNPQFEDGYTFWVDLKDKKTDEVTGKVLLRIDIATKDEVEECPLGQGRSQPNQNPFLPDPEGRMQLTADPRKILIQLIGKDNWLRIKASLVMVICLLVTIYMLPSILGSLIANMLTP